MLNKNIEISKLSMEFLGYIILSVITAVFSYTFLYHMSISVAIRIIEKRTGSVNMVSDSEFLSWLSLVCFIASLIIFFAFFLFFSGQKIQYILTITKAVKMIEGGQLDLKIAVNGDDELSELATSLNRLSLTLQEQMKVEERSNQDRHDLVRSLSHDIRTPLTAIISYSDFIKTGRYDSLENLSTFADNIQKKAYRIQWLTDLLLNQDQASQEITTVLNGRLLFEQLVGEFKDSLEEEHYTVRLTNLLEEDFDARVIPEDILRVFDNLYSNIIKYGYKNQDVTLKLMKQDQYLILTQTNAITKDMDNQTKSYGIGLSNIRNIVKKYGGDVNIHSDKDQYQIELCIRYL